MKCVCIQLSTLHLKLIPCLLWLSSTTSKVYEKAVEPTKRWIQRLARYCNPLNIFTTRFVNLVEPHLKD